MAGLTLDEVAPRVGISAPYLSMLETGRKPLTPEIAIRLLRMYFPRGRAAMSATNGRGAGITRHTPIVDLPELITVEELAALGRRPRRGKSTSDESTRR